MRFPLALGALGPRAIALYYRGNFNLHVEGIEHLPRRGPALIAARHYHHLYDGAALILGLPRMVHIFVALDWVRTPRERRVMEIVCGAARWPVSLRSQQLPGGGESPGESIYARDEVLAYVRRSLGDAAQLLREGRVVNVFPEGFPAIEPGERRMRSDDILLPFAPGFVSIVQLAQRGGGRIVPIVPAGFEYARDGEKYDITLRLGEPVRLDGNLSREQAVNWVHTRVRALSGLG